MKQPDPPAWVPAAVAMLSCVVVALADIVSWTLLVEDYNPISKTISALAVGPGSSLLDLGLWTFAAGCVALGFGMFRLRLRDRTWLLASLSVLMLGPVIGVIAFFNEYAGTQNAGADIHLYAVYTLGVLVALAALLVVPTLRILDNRLTRRGLNFAIVWLILAPLFFVIPDGWKGGYERGLALMLLGWVTAMAFFLQRRAGAATGLQVLSICQTQRCWTGGVPIQYPTNEPAPVGPRPEAFAAAAQQSFARSMR